MTTHAHLETLRRLGFNRLSMGIQDFHPEVQEAIHRVQPLEMTRDLIEEARRLGFDSINVDLIYGLPLQTAERFAHTVEQVVAHRRRIASPCSATRTCRGCASSRARWPRASPKAWRNSASSARALKAFSTPDTSTSAWTTSRGPNDELAVAQRERTLHRNFQGYTTKAGADLYGMGVSAISSVGACYAQNDRDVAPLPRAHRAPRHRHHARLPPDRGRSAPPRRHQPHPVPRRAAQQRNRAGIRHRF